MFTSQFFKDKKNIVIMVLSLFFLSAVGYIIFSPSSFQRANKVLQKQYNDLQKDIDSKNKQIDSLKTKEEKYNKSIEKLTKNTLKTDSLIRVKDSQIGVLKNDLVVYKTRYDFLNKEYMDRVKGGLTVKKSGGELINSLNKRVN
jgi:peptidoglycan hydrolase CwlO-like protein